MRNLISSSALRLCDWLFDNGDIQFTHVDKALIFAFRTKKREVTQFGVFVDPDSGFASTNRTQYPFKTTIAHRNPCAFLGTVFPALAKHQVHTSSNRVRCSTNIDSPHSAY